MKFLSRFNLKIQLDKYFPLAVYGTLRSIPFDQGNSSLMYIREPIKHKKCFIPHFVPTGIQLYFKKNACGIAELFFYKEEDWSLILPVIDRLEGFSSHNKSPYGYKRTLINVRIIPDDYADQIYDEGIMLENRDLKIPREYWDFPKVAAWVYSNSRANNLCKQNLDNFENPIIFD